MTSLYHRTPSQTRPQSQHYRHITSFTSTNVKLRNLLLFDLHMTFIWPSPDPYLTLISSFQLKKSCPVGGWWWVDQPITDPTSGSSFYAWLLTLTLTLTLTLSLTITYQENMFSSLLNLRVIVLFNCTQNHHLYSLLLLSIDRKVRRVNCQVMPNFRTCLARARAE